MASSSATPFQAIGPDAVEALLARMEIEELQAGATLFNEGEPGDALYLLLEGQLRISCGQGDVQVVVGVIESGEVVGEMAVLEPAPRSATATAYTDTKVAKLSTAEFTRMIGEGDTAALHILHQIRIDLCRRLRDVDDRLEAVLCGESVVDDEHAEAHLLGSLMKTLWPWG